MKIWNEILRIGGPTAAISIVVLFIIKEFLKYMNKRDERFTQLIGNHLNHNTDALNKLTQVVSELSIYIRKLNGK